MDCRDCRLRSRKRDFELHYEVNRENAQRLNLAADVVFVHDPQPIYLPQFTPEGQVARWVWRCHIDASQPDRCRLEAPGGSHSPLPGSHILHAGVCTVVGMPDVPGAAVD